MEGKCYFHRWVEWSHQWVISKSKIAHKQLKTLRRSNIENWLQTEKNYIFYYLLSAVWTLRLKYLSNAVWSIFKQLSALNLGIFNLMWRRAGLIVSAPDSGSGGPGSSPGPGHCVVFLGKTLYSHSASLHPGVQMGTSKCAGVTLWWTSIPSRGE